MTTSNQPFDVAAFYHFARLPGFREMREPVLALMKREGIRGSVLLAEEGVNGTISGKPEALARALAGLKAITGIEKLDHKLSHAAALPFKRMKVRLKKEIVTIGPVKADPTERVGQYVAPEDWNALISEPGTIVLDTRNSYEYRVGSFANAIDPHTDSFGEFPAFVRETLKADPKAKIAMFCTGGIRCEKASSFMLYEGYENVFHLKGGILKYLEVIPADKSLWQGECYVFDERVSVGHGLVPGDWTICHGCLDPVSAEERGSPLYEEGVCCPACAHKLSEDQKASNRERQRQVEIAAQRGSRHLGQRA
jgi:UPF0176 protein